jgi:hypothetical protein
MMIANAAAATEIDILAQVVGADEPALQSDLARMLLEMRFSDDAQARIRDLLDRNNRGVLTEAERDLLDKYLRVGQFLDLLQAKARLTLQKADTES